MGKKNVSLKSIAQECGVSINTVSHALRDFPDIASETKQKICQKAIELGYMPTTVSQRLRNEEKAVVALLIDSFSNLYYTTLCDELIKIFNEKNEYDVQILFYNGDDMSVLKQCVLQRVDMLVTHAVFTQEALAFAKLNNIKIVMAGSNTDNINIDIISVDERVSCAQAARYLWGIHKSSKFVFVGIEYPVSFLRLQYFRDALLELGETDVVAFNHDKEDIRELMRYIREGYRSVFFYNDALAYTVLSELNEIIVDVRKSFPDLHLIGFDGLCEAICGMNQITTIKIDYREFAEAIYKVIKVRLENPKAEQQKAVISTIIHQRRNGK